MRYLSVCSGIEAATVAWHHLGWTPVGFSEIEPFPSAVLAHHYPNVPNYGDMTKHEEWPIGAGTVNLLVGGTPCQSFSVAGLRRGLTDPRGGLMLTYLEIARRLRPRWIVWENVPGVLSSNGGRDFGSFLGALGQLGYGWAYRVLDAQWVRTQRHPRAVPQRRRRVFVVGCLGDPARAAQVLFERESVQRDPAPRRAPGQGAAADAQAGAGAGCITSHDVAPCLETTSHDYSRADGFTMVAGTLGNRGLRSHTEIDGHGAYIPQPVPIQDGREMQKAQNGIGVGQSGDPAYTLDTTGSQAIAHPVPFTKSKRAQSVTDDETWVDGKVNPTLSLFDQGDTRATTVAVMATIDMQACKGNTNIGDGVVSPTLCKPSGNDVHAVAYGTDCYNGAITGDVAATMGTPGSSVNASGSTVMAAAYGMTTYETPKFAEEVQPTLTVPSPSGGGQPPAMVQAMTVRRLTPRECERLQGFPDDYTMIPWRKKPVANCPDGPRYKALGNSMAVNCMAWIGERIAAVDAATPSANRPSEG